VDPVGQLFDELDEDEWDRFDKDTLK